MLAYLLKVSPEVDRIRTVVRKRLLDQPRVEAGMKQLNRMLITLHEKGFVKLLPSPPVQTEEKGQDGGEVREPACINDRCDTEVSRNFMQLHCLSLSMRRRSLLHCHRPR